MLFCLVDLIVTSQYNSRVFEYSMCIPCRYFMALVQEMAVKIDQGFLGAILALFTPTTDPQADKLKVTTPLPQTASAEQCYQGKVTG